MDKNVPEKRPTPFEVDFLRVFRICEGNMEKFRQAIDDIIDLRLNSVLTPEEYAAAQKDLHEMTLRLNLFLKERNSIRERTAKLGQTTKGSITSYINHYEKKVDIEK